MSPDRFLLMILESNTADFLACVRTILEKLINPPFTIEEFLDMRQRDGLRQTVALLRRYTHQLE